MRSAPVSKGKPKAVKGDEFQLRQAARVLQIVEKIGRYSDFDDDSKQLIKAIRFARKLVERVIANTAAGKRRQGRAL